MLDTLKIAIPLTRTQHKRIHSFASETDCWTWAQLNQVTGETLARRYKGLAQMDGESFHREIRFDYPPTWTEEAKLWCEFSVTKYWYGHNISLLYDWPQALRQFRELLNEQFNMKRASLPEIDEWEVWRADPCYAFRFPDQGTAQLYLDGLKRQRFPRKQPTINPSSIFFGGGTYSFKVYLKLPEFRAHDRKELLKQKSSLEWVDYLEDLAHGVLRVEGTLRRKYLKRQGIKTVADMIGNRAWLEWDAHYQKLEEFDPNQSMMAISTWNLRNEGVTEVDLTSSAEQHKLIDGNYYHAPDHKIGIELSGVCLLYEHKHGGFTYHNKPILIDKLRTLLHKFLGGVQGMESVDKVEAVLLQRYKPVTAAKLVSFWLYVQKFGANKAKEVFGKRSFYYQRKQLKDVGLGLMEAHDKIIKIDPELFRTFKLDIPSQYATNKFDDFRNSGNILNLRPQNEVS